jgi:pyruvate,water dikinase
MIGKKIYDNSNIAESYSGVTTPLTFSFIRYIYQEVYQYFSKFMGVDNRTIQSNKYIFEHMVEFIGFRIYYNLNSWYTMLSFFPGYKFSSRFMEKMMGVKKRAVFSFKRSDNFFKKYFFYFPKTILQSVKIIFIFLFLDWQIKKFSKYFKQVFTELNLIDLDNLNLTELKKLYIEIENKLLNRWKVPIVNDFAVMVSTGLLDKLFKEWLSSNESYFYIINGVNKRIPYLDLGKRIAHIVYFIQQDQDIKSIFTKEYSDKEILRLLRDNFKDHKVTQAIESYFNDFGMRMPDELKLESKTLIEKPENIISILRKLLNVENLNIELNEIDIRYDSFQNLNLLKRILIKLLLRWSKNAVLRREKMRFYRTLIFGYARKIFLAIGQKMTSDKIIKNKRDIFYLTKEEIFDIIDNHQINFVPDLIINQRKQKYKKFKNVSFPRRIESDKDIAIIEEEILQAQSTKQSSIVDKLIGRVASRPNNIKNVSGVAITLKEFDPSVDFKDKILVTKQTDPGWTIIFPFLRGIVVERGGMLSHAAIVARELGIPCIVGVDNATDVIENGAKIILDLQKGLIKKI